MTPHKSVMLEEVLKYLQPKDGETILDATFGAGGYTRAILATGKCNVIGSDRDENVVKFADEIKKEYEKRFSFHNVKFSEIPFVIADNSLDGIVLDLGVSSMQLDVDNRGFSFNKDAPLNMSMGKSDCTAFELVNECDKYTIANMLYEYGDETNSRAIAEKIVQLRKIKPIETTVELANIVRSCFPAHKKGKIDNATKTFQALRIVVNDELEELKVMLNSSINLLKSGGRLIVVSFHSLEDGMVKKFFNENSDSKTKKINKYKEESKKTIFKILTKHPIAVSQEEANENRRARSAKLRGAIKC
jgi:16S rRNA (cytosine1402-N4)-methyltransferase